MGRYSLMVFLIWASGKFAGPKDLNSHMN